MSAMTEYLRRAIAPRVVVATSRLRWPQRVHTAVRRGLGLRPHIELFFAFDDPYSAIALPGLIEIARIRNAELRLYPLVERGIAGDPAQQQRRLHAVADSRKLARRDHRELRRSQPLPAQDCAFLAAWTAAAHNHANINHFAAAALAQLWFQSHGAPTREAFRALHLAHLAALPPDDHPEQAAALARNSARLKRLGHWESPAARVAGEWFFAHERLAQIDARLLALKG
jgi:2-hydroxychromene-2-carboxylate isomerase